MIRILVLISLVGMFGVAVAWLGAHPGHVNILWGDLQMETSLVVLVVGLCVAALVVGMIYALAIRLLSVPARYRQRRDLRQYRLAWAEATRGIAALAAGDMEAASQHTGRVEKSLGVTPLALLLRAQISKNTGDDDASRLLLEQLLEYPDTEYLAAKSLADAAHKQARLPQALALSERAHHANPHASQGAWQLLEIHLETGQFQEAEAHIRQARKSGAFTRSDVVQASGKLALKKAREFVLQGHAAYALNAAKQAMEHLPGQLDVAELYAELLSRTSAPQKAIPVIMKQWKHLPSKALAELFVALIAEESPRKQKRRVQALIAQNPAAAENMLLPQL